MYNVVGSGGQQETDMSLDNASHPGRPGLDELVPSRYAVQKGKDRQRDRSRNRARKEKDRHCDRSRSHPRSGRSERSVAFHALSPSRPA